MVMCPKVRVFSQECSAQCIATSLAGQQKGLLSSRWPEPRRAGAFEKSSFCCGSSAFCQQDCQSNCPGDRSEGRHSVQLKINLSPACSRETPCASRTVQTASRLRSFLKDVKVYCGCEAYARRGPFQRRGQQREQCQRVQGGSEQGS